MTTKNKIKVIMGLIEEWEGIGKVPPCFTSEEFLDELKDVLED